MDFEIVRVPVDERGRLTGEHVAAVLEAQPDDGYFAIAATAGVTNLGIVDDLDGVADVAAAHGLWFHVDGAYGGAALAAPGYRHLFAGVEQADSFIVDPHKWLFSTFDCCALVYRDPEPARQAHTQHASYLDAITDRDEWNPSDYAVHLSRRARGLPFWFSLAMHGTEAYREAIETTLEVAHAGADLVRERDGFYLVTEPELSIVVFRKEGWSPADYDGLVRRRPRVGLRLLPPQLPRRRDRHALVRRQPQDHRRRPRLHPRLHGRLHRLTPPNDPFWAPPPALYNRSRGPEPKPPVLGPTTRALQQVAGPRSAVS